MELSGLSKKTCYFMVLLTVFVVSTCDAACYNLMTFDFKYLNCFRRNHVTSRKSCDSGTIFVMRVLEPPLSDMRDYLHFIWTVNNTQYLSADCATGRVTLKTIPANRDDMRSDGEFEREIPSGRQDVDVFRYKLREYTPQRTSCYIALENGRLRAKNITGDPNSTLSNSNVAIVNPEFDLLLAKTKC